MPARNPRTWRAGLPESAWASLASSPAAIRKLARRCDICLSVCLDIDIIQLAKQMSYPEMQSIFCQRTLRCLPPAAELARVWLDTSRGRSGDLSAADADSRRKSYAMIWRARRISKKQARRQADTGRLPFLLFPAFGCSPAPASPSDSSRRPDHTGAGAAFSIGRAQPCPGTCQG